MLFKYAGSLILMIFHNLDMADLWTRKHSVALSSKRDSHFHQELVKTKKKYILEWFFQVAKNYYT